MNIAQTTLALLLNGKRTHNKDGYATPHGIEFLETVVKNEIKKRFDKVTLRRLGELACIRSIRGEGFHYHSIESDNPRFSLGDIVTIKEQGLACFVDSGECAGVGKLRTQEAIGLTRSGKWVVISVRIILKQHQEGQRERALSVWVQQTSLGDAMERTRMKFFSVWHMLKREVEEWERLACARHEPLLKAKEGMETLDAVLSSLMIKHLDKGADPIIAEAERMTTNLLTRS